MALLFHVVVPGLIIMN